MKTIDELQAQLRLICSELENLKEAQKAETRDVNFREIAARAERYPISGHPMMNSDEHTKDMYILMLLSVAALDDEKYEESFLTIYRIAYGMYFSGDMENLFLSAKQMKFETLDECTRLFIGSNIRLVLLLECMMIAAGFESGKRRALEYISELAVMLNVSKDEIEFLANLARVVLTQDLNEYRTDKKNVYGEIFDCYINVFSNQFIIQLIQPLKKLKSRNLHNIYALLNSYIIDKIDDVYIDKIVFIYRKCLEPEQTRMVEYVTNGLNIDLITDKYLETGELGVSYPEDESKTVLFGVMSSHPLAHSKAIAQYIAAGGVIDNNTSIIDDINNYPKRSC